MGALGKREIGMKEYSEVMKRYAIYGAGSLGTVLGAYITKNGGQIDLINRNRAHV